MSRFSFLNRRDMRIFRSTNSGNSKGGTSYTLEEQSDDAMIEIGTPCEQDGRRVPKTITTKRRCSAVTRWISSNRIETLGIVLVSIGIGIVVTSVVCPGLFDLRGNAPSNNSVESGPSSTASYTLPPFPAPVVAGPGTPFPTTVAQPVAVPTVAAMATNVYPSIYARLSEVLPNPSLLDDPETPQGRAYQWINKVDELRWSADHPSLVQRFVLAAFYFATGGRRSTATWEVCSAVPAETTDSNNAFSTRCVFEDGHHVCATFEDFLECPEYFQRYNLTAPANPKKRWLSSSSECDWYGVFCNADGDVEQLTLANNGLEGELIPELDMLTELYLLNLGENNLVGSLPEWEGLTQLEFVSLYDNMLEGIIPWRAWKKLETLDLAKNNFTGALILPEKWIGLKTLILSDNRLDLTLRPRVGLWTELEILDLSGNTLAGELPGTMGNWKRLRSLNLANCQVTGHIPPGIVALSNLVELQLQYNDLNGTLPMGLFELTSLKQLHLEENQFSGTLSSAIGQLTSLRELSLDRSGLSGALPESLGDLIYLEILHLQFNEFNGDVPEALCSVPTLFELEADCDGQGNVDCSCCTQCCSLKAGQCRRTQENRVG